MYKLTYNSFRVEVSTDEITLTNGEKKTVYYAEARHNAGIYINSGGRTWPTEKEALASVLNCIDYWRRRHEIIQCV